MFLFSLSILFALGAVGAFLYAKFVGPGSKELEPVKYGPAIVAGLVAVLFLGFASTTMVSTKNIGVVTSFNKPTGHLSNGLHLKAPWAKVHELDGAIQIDAREGENATQVRLGNNSMATVDNSVRWRLRPEATDDLFLNYRDQEKIKNDLVLRELNVSLNDIFATYDPIAAVTENLNPEGDAKPAAAQEGSDLTALATKVAEDMRRKVGDKIEILDVAIPVVHFDQSTQDRINAYQAEVGNTRIAQQRKQTATAEAEAARELAGAISNDPNVLVSKCLDIVKELNQSPLGCWPGTTVIPTR